MSRIFFLSGVSFILLFSLPLSAQPHLASTGCRLIGGDSLAAGTVATYSLMGCKGGAWRLSCGTINNSTDSSATVYFDSANCSSTVLTALSGGQPVATRTITLVQALPFDGGTIVAANQPTGRYHFPALLTATAARQGACNGTYSYQWYQSADNQHFQAIPGATGQHYQPGPVDSTTYFKRLTSCGTVSTYTAAVAIHPTAPLSAGSITPAVQAINYGQSPAGLTMPGVTGGIGSYTYQWQSTTAMDDHAWQSISGAVAITYTPGALDSTTFFRLIVVSNGDSLYSIRGVVSVFPMLVCGPVSPAAQTLAPGGQASLLTINGVSGGNGVYTYQWYSSADGQNWTLLNQAQASDYSPGAMSTTTWYRVVVTSNGVPVTSTSAVAQVTAAATMTNQ